MDDDDANERAPAKPASALIDPLKFDPKERGLEGVNDEAILLRIAELEQQHSDLDAAIEALEATGTFDRISLQHLKKRKLTLKDMIATLKDKLTPDIIA